MIKMGVESEADKTVKLLAEKVFFSFKNLCHETAEKIAKCFHRLIPEK